MSGNARRMLRSCVCLSRSNAEPAHRLAQLASVTGVRQSASMANAPLTDAYAVLFPVGFPKVPSGTGLKVGPGRKLDPAYRLLWAGFTLIDVAAGCEKVLLGFFDDAEPFIRAHPNGIGPNTLSGATSRPGEN
jgi:hypothetical protein